MTAHWAVQGEQLTRRWSETGITYDAKWMLESYLDESCPYPPAFDLMRLSPFGGAKWYSYPPAACRRRERSLS